jgi:hypothetical protein
VQREEHRHEALEAVAQQREQGGRAVAGAQHVGGTRVARAVGVRIGQAERLAHHHREGDRPDQVGDGDEQHGGEHEGGAEAVRYNPPAILANAARA